MIWRSGDFFIMISVESACLKYNRQAERHLDSEKGEGEAAMRGHTPKVQNRRHLNIEQAPRNMLFWHAGTQDGNRYERAAAPQDAVISFPR